MHLYRRHISEEQLRKYENYMTEIFTAFDLDLDTPATRQTPQRYIRALFDSTEGYEGDPKLLTAFETECRGGSDCRLSQVVEGPIHFFALCEHHALPFHGHAYVGYIAHARRARGGAIDTYHILAGCLRWQCGPAGGILDGVWGASMNALVPLETLYDMEHGNNLSLPPDLAALYGRLQFPLHPGRPYVIGNFVSTLDGVVTLNIPGQAGGGPISGFNPHDHLVMGLLRA